MNIVFKKSVNRKNQQTTIKNNTRVKSLIILRENKNQQINKKKLEIN